MPEAEMIATVAQLVIKHGIPAAMQILRDWENPVAPTIEDIRALRDIKPAAEYFDNPDSAA